MRKVNASDFQINCLQFLEDVAKTGETILITQNGIARTQLAAYKPKTLFGAFKGTINIHGDIISPIETHWEAQQ